jgi:geranylgeranyl diphosphate synthase type II
MSSSSIKAKNDFELKSYLAEKKQLIDSQLQNYFRGNEKAQRLWDAMGYSTLNGGKRIRGVLFLASLEALGETNLNKALNFALGLECIHAMSLVHDDLPCMDDDDMRRGKPTCHKAYDEATALLAGDALLVEGFTLCLNIDFAFDKKVAALQEVLNAVGVKGMCGGQMLDLQNTDSQTVNLENLELMHSMKTGALLRASIVSAAILVGVDKIKSKALLEYSKNIGLAFQVADDILDLEASSEDLGKTAGKDAEQNKSTYPRILGLEGSKRKAKELVESAKKSLSQAGIQSEALSKIADYIIDRKH